KSKAREAVTRSVASPLEHACWEGAEQRSRLAVSCARRRKLETVRPVREDRWPILWQISSKLGSTSRTPCSQLATTGKNAKR
ncbi:hypothetical protein U9M48_037976, partial [Paspalum notatum var. saurae]